MLSMQELWDQSLAGELDPTCHDYDLVQPNKFKNTVYLCYNVLGREV